MTSIAAGAVTVTLGLSLPWALVAIVAGQVTGAVFMAGHSAQGPRLGIPQMIQSRAQFGYLGASVPLVVVMVMYIGFFAVGAVLNGQALADWLHINPDLGIVIANVVAAVLAIYGYRMLHGVVGAMAVVGGVMFAFLSVQLVRNNDVGAALAWGHFSVGPFLLAMSVAATWQLTFAPYVADYSRYLPANTKISSSFWTTYAGTVLASSWMFAFGAIAVAVAGDAFNGGSIEFIVRQGAFAPGLFFLLLIVGNTGGNAFNVYGLFMSATTTVSAFRPFRVTVTVRTLIITAGAAIGTGVAIAGRGNFIGNFTSFIVLLTYFLIPWTSINLVDFYLVRKERYNLAAIFDPRGQYGGADWRTLLAFGIGIAVELPFVSSSFYTGPLVRDVGGADISWILGIIVSGGAYYLLMRRFPVRRGVDAQSVTGDPVAAKPAPSAPAVGGR